MSWIYSEADYNGYVDDNYRRYPFFADRGIEFNRRWNSIKTSTLLIAGAGWGFLVQELMEVHGFTDVWGCDASDYAVNVAAPRELPQQYADRVLLGDITDDVSMKQVANAAGIKGGNPKFRAVLTEDVLPCLTDTEIPTALSVLRGRTQDLAHIITPQMAGSERQSDGSTVYPGGVQMPGFTWWTHDEWLTAIGTGEPIAFTDRDDVVNA